MLHVVPRVVIPVDSRRQLDGAGQHGRMFAGTVVMQTGEWTRLTRQPRPACRQGLVWAAGQRRWIQPQSGKHARGNRDMLRLSAVGGAGQGQLVVSPSERVEASAAKQWHDLKRFRAGTPPHGQMRVAHRSLHRAIGPNHGGMDTVARLDAPAPCHHYVESGPVDPGRGSVRRVRTQVARAA